MKKHTELTHLIAAGLLLAALSPLKTHAAADTWKGTSGALWDLATTGNWTPIDPWANGNDAIFGSSGGTLVMQNSGVTASSLTFSAAGYNITNANTANFLTLSSTAAITNNAAGVVLNTSIAGTNGLKYYGPGDLTLRGNQTAGLNDQTSADTYTGDTFVNSGVLILQVTNEVGSQVNNLQNHGGQWACSAVGGVNAGATLKIGNFYMGASTNNYQAPRGQIQENTHVIMNGGTFDGNGEDNLQNYPAIYGTGYIINSSAVARSVLKMSPPDNLPSQTVTNACIIGDPNPPFPSLISGKVAHEIDIDIGNSGSTTWIFTGASSNMFGSWRIASGGAVLKFDGAGTMGYPNIFTTPNTMRINGNNPLNYLDLNGTSQQTGGFAGSANSTGNGGQPNGLVCNNKAGTLSILTIGAANLGLNALPAFTTNIGTLGNPTNVTYTPGAGSVWAGAVLDNTNLLSGVGTGGILGVTKVGTNIAQFSGTWNISGPLVVSNGYLNLVPGTGSGATPVLNGPVYLYSNGGNSSLGLYTISQNAKIKVPALYIDGVRQPDGLYGCIGTTAPGAIPVSVISNGSTPAADVLQVGAPILVWDDGSKNYLWDSTSLNWSGQTWTDGSSATFGPTDLGATAIGTIYVNAPIVAHNLNFNANGYTLQTIGGGLTLNANATITSAGGTTNILLAGIAGTNGVSFAGTGVSYLEGANSYTGGTYIHSGTVILQSSSAGTGGASAYAIDGVAALDAGATLVVPGIWNGSTYGGDPDQFAVNGQVGASPQSFLHMTGGTLDLNNDPGTQHFPVPDGTGTIINNGSWSQARLQVYADGQDHSFYGVIADGNNGVLNGDNTSAVNGGQGPGYQIGALRVVGGVSTTGVAGGAAGPYQHWYWYGSNTFSGAIYLDKGVYLKLMGPNGHWGNPATNGLTGPARLYNAVFDLNGHDQAINLITAGGNGIWQNTAPGTVSTLTIGYGNEQVFTRQSQNIFQDSWGGGGILALKKINTAPYAFPIVVPTTIATNCVQEIRGTGGNPPNTGTAVCTYSGDTTLLGGGLILTGTSTVSSNSAYRLFTPNNYTLLKLNYTGTAPCRQLWINGVQQPNGVYGSIGNGLGATGVAGIDPASTGTLTVTGYAPVVLSAAQSGGNLNFTWSGVYKLQSNTNLLGGTWIDVAGGGTSPASIPVNKTQKTMFFRLLTY